MDTSPPDPNRAKRKRTIALIVLAAFFLGAYFIFGPRIPREAQLRFDLPPTLRSDFASFQRERLASLTAHIIDREGSHVASLNLPQPRGLVGPRTGPAVVTLRPGRYVVRAKARSFEHQEVPLQGVFDLDGGEVVIELE